MEQRQLMKRSKQGLIAQLATSGILALLILLFGTWFFATAFGWTPTNGKISIVVLWVFIVGGWATTSLKLWLGWRARFYEIGPESLTLHLKAGMWGTTQTVYRYESFISVRMVQGYWGKKFGFGDIYIAIPKMEQDIVLRDVIDPALHLQDIQARMAERASGTSSLIN